jgi:hypothetical protein
MQKYIKVQWGSSAHLVSKAQIWRIQRIFLFLKHNKGHHSIPNTRPSAANSFSGPQLTTSKMDGEASRLEFSIMEPEFKTFRSCLRSMSKIGAELMIQATPNEVSDHGDDLG